MPSDNCSTSVSTNPNLLLYVFYPFKFSKADGLFSKIAPTAGQVSNSEQSPQVETPFPKAHFRISHICSQNTVFAPFVRHPSQLICSGKIGALFNSAHSFAVFSRNAWSSLIVAIYASHFSQSSPQYPIISFIGHIPPKAFLMSATNWACCFFKYNFTKGFINIFLASTHSVKSISVSLPLSVNTPIQIAFHL